MAYADEVLADAPLAYWRLGEAAGATTAVDATGSGYDGTYTASVTRGVTGLLVGDPDLAISVPGNHRVSADVPLTPSQVTVEAWFSTTSATTGVQHIGGRLSGYRVVLVNNSAYFSVRVGGVDVNAIGTTGGWRDGQPHHIVGTWDGTTARVYVDNVERGSAAAAGTLTPASQPFTMGTNPSAGDDFTGTIDEVALYGTALSPARIQAHYNTGRGVAGPITVAGQAATVAVAALEGTAITPITVLGEAAAVTVAALDGTAVSGVPPLVVPGETATVTVAALDGAPVISLPPIVVGTEPRDLSTSRRRRTGIGYVDLTIPVAPEPPTIVREPIPIVVDTLPDPAVTGGVVTPMTPTVLREATWGRPRLRVGHTDVTYFRGKPAQIVDYQLLDPYGHGPATLRFPQISFWELSDFGTGDLEWLTKNALVEIDHVKDQAYVDTIWPGHIDAFDFDDTGSLLVDCSGELAGRMDKTHRTQRLVRGVKDAGHLARIALSVQNKRFRLTGSAEDWSRTGIEMENTGGGLGTNLAFLDYVLANAVTEDLDSWTILPVEGLRRVYDLVQRDRTTCHATVYLGARGVSARLRDDQLEQPTRMFGEGVAPNGARWRGAEYPNLGPEVVPAYPYTDNRTFGHPGLTDADTDTGDGVRVLEDELLGSGLLRLEERNGQWTTSTTEAVEEVQRRAGLPVTGKVDPATWTAVWGDGDDQQRLSQAKIRPLVWDPATERFLLSPNGSVLGRNPAHDRRVPRIERAVSFGEGVTKKRARQWLRRERNRLLLANWRGTITLTSDVMQGEHTYGQPGTPMSRMDLRPGQNIRVKRFGSPNGMLMHIAAKTVTGLDGDTPQVELAVDTQFRDAITLAEMLERDRAARRDPAREWLNQHRRSAQPSDAIVGWDYEAGAGVVRRTRLTGNQWNVIKVIGGQAGEIQRVDLTTEDQPAAFVCMVAARPVRPGELAQRVGDPFIQVGTEEVWQQIPVADWLAGLDPDERKEFRDGEHQKEGFVKAEDGSWVPPEFYQGNIIRTAGKWQSVDAPPSGQELADLQAEEANRREERINAAITTFADLRVGVYVSGTSSEPCGYWPRSKVDANGNPSGHPITGRHRDDASFSYWTAGGHSPWLYLAIFPDRDCTIHGRMYDQLIEGA